MKRKKRKMIYNFTVLFFLYLNIILSFALIYMVLDISEYGPIVDHFRSHVKANSWFDPMLKPLYFSAITLFSVGYGDVTPFGWARAIAIVEALIGYILPATVALQILRFFPHIFRTHIDSERDEW